MKKLIFISLLLLVISFSVFALTDADIEYIIDLGKRYPPLLKGQGVVNKPETAVAIGEAIAREVYGDEKVDKFLPFSATEDEDHKVWYVQGAPLNVGWDKIRIIAGPIIMIRKYDGNIISVKYGR